MTDDPSKPEITPGKCFTGSLISGGLGFLLYQLTAAIVSSFAATPVVQSSYLGTRIGIAVRTLVVGGCSLGTFIFAISALGLAALGIQTLWLQLKKSQPKNEG